MDKLDLEKCRDWDYVKDKLLPRLVRVKGNESNLRSTLRKDIFDMSIVFYVLIDSYREKDFMNYKIAMMTNYYTDEWGKSFDEVYKVAMNNLNSHIDSVEVNQCDELASAINAKTDQILDKIKDEIGNEPRLKDIPQYMNDMFVNDVKKGLAEKLSQTFFIAGLNEVCAGSSIMLSKDMLDVVAKKIGDSFYFSPVFLGSMFVVAKTKFDATHKTMPHPKRGTQALSAEFMDIFRDISIATNSKKKQDEGKQEVLSAKSFLYDMHERKIKLI